MLKSEGTFHSDEEMKQMVRDNVAKRDDFLIFTIGDKVVIQGENFFISDMKNGRIILRPENALPTARERKLVNWKDQGTLPKQFTVGDSGLVSRKR